MERTDDVVQHLRVAKNTVDVSQKLKMAAESLLSTGENNPDRLEAVLPRDYREEIRFWAKNASLTMPDIAWDEQCAIEQMDKCKRQCRLVWSTLAESMCSIQHEHDNVEIAPQQYISPAERYGALLAKVDEIEVEMDGISKEMECATDYFQQMYHIASFISEQNENARQEMKTFYANTHAAYNACSQRVQNWADRSTCGKTRRETAEINLEEAVRMVIQRTKEFKDCVEEECFAHVHFLISDALAPTAELENSLELARNKDKNLQHAIEKWQADWPLESAQQESEVESVNQTISKLCERQYEQLAKAATLAVAYLSSSVREEQMAQQKVDACERILHARRSELARNDTMRDWEHAKQVTAELTEAGNDMKQAQDCVALCEANREAWEEKVARAAAQMVNLEGLKRFSPGFADFSQQQAHQWVTSYLPEEPNTIKAVEAEPVEMKRSNTDELLQLHKTVQQLEQRLQQVEGSSEVKNAWEPPKESKSTDQSAESVASTVSCPGLDTDQFAVTNSRRLSGSDHPLSGWVTDIETVQSGNNEDPVPEEGNETLTKFLLSNGFKEGKIYKRSLFGEKTYALDVAIDQDNVEVFKILLKITNKEHIHAAYKQRRKLPIGGSGQILLALRQAAES